MPQGAPSHRVKIKRAKEHIDDLESRIVAFRQLRPYRAIFDDDFQFQSGEIATFAIDEAVRIPEDWGAIIGEIIHNCRTCLENAWHDIEGRPPSNTNFPFHGNTEGMKAGLHRKKTATKKTAVEFLLTIKETDRWDPLVMLANLDDRNKHRTMIVCGAQLAQGLPLTDAGQFFRPLEDGAIFTCILNDLADKVNMEHQLPFEIAFAEAEITKGDAVLPTLENLLSIADSIVSAFIAKELVR
jgi:hypothetical protein